MNKLLLITLIATGFTAFGLTAFADELDGNSAAANQTTRAQNIPQTVVMKMDKAGNTFVYRSDKALDFKDAQDAQKQLANATFEKVASVEEAAVTQNLSELDRDHSSSSWHYYYPHNRWYGGGVYFNYAPVYYGYNIPAYYYNYPTPVYYSYGYYNTYIPYSYGYAWGGYNYGFFRPHFAGGWNNGWHGGHGGWRR